MCEATTDRTPAVVLKYVRAKRGSGVTVVVGSVVAGEVVGNMKNELKVDGRSHKTGDGCEDECGV